MTPLACSATGCINSYACQAADRCQVAAVGSAERRPFVFIRTPHTGSPAPGDSQRRRGGR